MPGLCKEHSTQHLCVFWEKITEIENEIMKMYTNTLMRTITPFESNLKTMKSASGKGHPGEKHSPGEETSRPQQCSEAWESREKKVHKALCSDRASRDCADSSPNSEGQLNFVDHFSHF